MEEVSGTGGSSKAAAEAGAGDKAAGSEKRTKTIRVQQGYIDSLLKVYPFQPFPGEESELEKFTDPDIREMLRMTLAPATAIIRAARDKDEAIIKQYLAQGYAEEEVEVSDDELTTTRSRI